MGWMLGLSQATGLTDQERNDIEAMTSKFGDYRRRNETIDAYYEGDVRPRPIGPDTLMKQVELDMDISCDWPRKAVHALANLVRFDGFVFEGEADEGLDAAMRRCGFAAAFSRHRVGMLKNGCMFATVGMEGGRAYVRMHSANSGTAIMDATTERMRCGMVVAESRPTEWSPRRAVPTQVNYHAPGRLVAIRRTAPSQWVAEGADLPGDTCMMVPIAYRPTDTKPLGGTRIGQQVRDLVNDVLHLRQVLALSCELYAIPMRYIVGLTAANMEALKQDPKWAIYLNPLFVATRDAKSGKTPELGQLPANSPAALLELIYADAKMFASATGIPLNSLGIVQDNPSSAEAIAEGRKDLTDEAQDLIDGQLKPALAEVARLVMMVEHNLTRDQLSPEQLSVGARFKNPAMPSISASTDAAMKIANVNPEFAGTDVFFEMVGFDAETRRRIRTEMRMNRMRANTPSLLGNTLSLNQRRQQGVPDGNLLSAPSEGDDADIAQ